MRTGLLFLTAVSLIVFAAANRRRSDEIPFAKHTIDLGASEPCAWADINGDGRLDIVSGENWYEAPRWTKHKFRELNFTNNYIDDFSDLPLDVDHDGHVDIVSVSWFSKRMSWWKNPGSTAGTMWKETVIEGSSPIEFAFLVDLDNDGKAQELLPQFGDTKQPLAWYEAMPNGTFARHVVSPQSYGHGIGAGDVNGDGRNDILTPKGWFEAPKDPRNEPWTFHPDWDLTKDGGLGFLHVLDVNGDGKPDIVTSNAHNYGVFWLEQMPDGKWKQHPIDDAFSQSHATSLVDWNGDGRKAIVTGKRFMAHNGHDPGEREPLGLYWYEWLGNEWARHVIDYGTRTGSGMQIAVADYDNDGDIDFAVGGKSGLFLFENQTSQPKRK